MIIFVPFLIANFGQKYKQKLYIFALFWHIFGKIQLDPKENLVEFVTLDIFKLYMSNKADRLQKCSQFKLYTPNRAKWHDAYRKG